VSTTINLRGRPVRGMSGKPFDMLESMTSVDLALCVPYIRIFELDRQTKKEKEGVRPFMLDLVEQPRFGEPSPFSERPLVSLENITMKAEMAGGLLNYTTYTIAFVVHRPEEVFRGGPDQTVWRSVLREGAYIMLEYGWRGGSAENTLFSGDGYFDRETGVVVPSVKQALIDELHAGRADQVHRHGEG
jgi:hypothetical protein